jgi:hypothetical protein
MKCPACQSTSNKIIEMRSRDEAIKRRRRCKCGHGWSTWETSVRTDRLVALVRQAAELTAHIATVDAERPAPQAAEPSPPRLALVPPAPRPRTMTTANGITLARVSILEGAE